MAKRSIPVLHPLGFLSGTFGHGAQGRGQVRRIQMAEISIRDVTGENVDDLCRICVQLGKRDDLTF